MPAGGVVEITGGPASTAIEATATTASATASGIQASAALGTELEATATTASATASGVGASAAVESALEATATTASAAASGVQATAEVGVLSATAKTASATASGMQASAALEADLEVTAGTAVATASGIAATAAVIVPVGGITIGYDGTNYFAGSVDEVIIDANVRVMDDFPLVDPICGPNDVAFWPFSENAGSKVFATDMRSLALDVTGGTWAAGRVWYGIAFDGTNDYASYTPAVAETFTGRTLSVEVQVKFGAASACPLLTQAGGLNLAYNGAGGFTAALGGVTNPNSIVASFTPAVGTWYNLCLVYDGTYKELWVNGQKVGQVAATGTATFPATMLYVARDGAAYGNCTIDRIRIYRARLRPFYRYVPYFKTGMDGFLANEEWMTKP